LVLSLELFSKIKVPEQVFHIDQLWSHSLVVGKVAKAIAASQTDNKEMISNTFLAGTLHDLGKLILLSSLPDQYRQVIDMAVERNITMPEAERSVFDVPQSSVGSYLVGLWGFSNPIIEAIGFQNSIEKYPATTFTPALALHAANVLYYRNRPDEIIGKPLELNIPVLERLGLQDAAVEWEQICIDVMQDEE
jgi:HD-like signal output (HDOD) protein